MFDDKTSKLDRVMLGIIAVIITVLPWMALFWYMKELWVAPRLVWERTQLVFGIYFLFWSILPHVQIWAMKDDEFDSALRRKASIYMIKKIPYGLFLNIMRVLGFFVIPPTVLIFVKSNDFRLPGFLQTLFGHKDWIVTGVEGSLDRLLWSLGHRCTMLAENFGDTIESYSDVAVYGVRYAFNSKEGQFGLQVLKAGDSFEVAQLFSLKWFAFYSRWGNRISDEVTPWKTVEPHLRRQKFELIATSAGFKGIKSPT